MLKCSLVRQADLDQDEFATQTIQSEVQTIRSAKESILLMPQ